METKITTDLQKKFKKYQDAHRQSKFFQAEKGYKKLLGKRPGWADVLNSLGNLYLDQDRPDKAMPVFEKAARLSPLHLPACYNLGRLKQLENDHISAIKIYKKMLAQQPDMGRVWNNLGVACRETNKPDTAFDSFKKAVMFAPQMAEAWNNLGVAQDEQNLADEALKSYQKAIEIQPEYVSPHLNIGISLQKLDRFDEAEKHYNTVLKLEPENEITTFMLQSIGGKETPDAVPVEHVRNIFDQCADKFESILVDGLKYKTPELLFDLVQPCLAKNLTILDLGCGTGLGAQRYRPFAKHLTGVDVSSKMLNKAYDKQLYDHLEMCDVLDPWAFPEKFDLIYSSDVFVYFGSLDTILKSASSFLVKGGILTFSVEKLSDSNVDYKLFPSGRYAHSQQYIQKSLVRHGFQLKELKNADVRNQSGKPVKGLLIVAKKQ